MIYSNYKWKKELKIEHLKIKRERLEKAFGVAHDAIIKGTVENYYPIDILSDILILFPESISEELKKLNNVVAENKSEDVIKTALFNFSIAMKKELAKIEIEIEKEVN